MQETGRPLTSSLGRLGFSKSGSPLLCVSSHWEELDAVPCFIVWVTHDVRPMAGSIISFGRKDHGHMAPLLTPTRMVRASKPDIRCQSQRNQCIYTRIAFWKRAIPNVCQTSRVRWKIDFGQLSLNNVRILWATAIFTGFRGGIFSDTPILYYKVTAFVGVEKLPSHCSFLLYKGMCKAEMERDDGIHNQGFFPIYRYWKEAG